MAQSKAEQFYNEQIDFQSKELAKAVNQVRLYSTLRLALFLVICLSSYLLYGNYSLLAVLPIELALFIFLVHRFLDAKELRRKINLLLNLNSYELLALQGDWSNFGDGKEYKNGSHPFSLDMDLFGPKSFYQRVNRTALRAASDKLASVLAYGSHHIIQSNKAIASFSKEMKWCQEFIVEGQMRVADQDQRSIQQLKKIVFQNKTTSILKWIIPIISFSSVTLYFLDLIPSSVLTVVIFSLLVLIGNFLKSSNKVILPTTNLSNEVNAMITQLQFLGKVNVDDAETKTWIVKLTSEADSMQKELTALWKIQNRMSYRDNILVGVMLNLFFSWDFLHIDQLQAWLKKSEARLNQWEDELAELEVWVSGAVYHFNYSQSTFAEFTATNEFKIEGLGHPFVAQEKQVKNDVSIYAQENFLIITGPNMAGKSTYLRSVGLALFCANAGFPVLAKACLIPKVELYSSMRTSDDLTVESSYFHAELTRLRFIVDAIESGKKTFVILDEILKGTNSKDKEIGSARFLEKLKRLGTQGIIATHDLSLTKLTDEDSSFRNVYFDSTIEGDELSFDYTIRDGVCQNMNASFLLKRMKLVD